MTVSLPITTTPSPRFLLTGVDVEHTERRQNFENTLYRLLELGALPIINENDTVSTMEIASIGDNDTLAAIVACCARADLLVLLSDIDGLYTANPRTHPDAKLIPLVEEITPDILGMSDGAGSALGTGGMATKLRAAQMVTADGVDMVIANGAHPRTAVQNRRGRSRRHPVCGPAPGPLKGGCPMTTQEILTAARDAKRTVGVSGTAQRNRALLGMADALDDAANRAAILSANAADPGRRPRPHLGGDAGPPCPERQAAGRYVPGHPGSGRPARPGGGGAAPHRAAQRPRHRKDRRPDGGHRHHLREPPQRHQRRGGPGPQERQCLRAALRQGSLAHQQSHCGRPAPGRDGRRPARKPPST